MANLHSFTSELTREQTNGGVIEDQHIMEADRSTAEVIGRQQSVKSEHEKQGLGRALLVLFQASRTALRKAMADLQGENVVSSALRSLISYVEPVEAKEPTSASQSRMQDVYRPLMDKIMKRSDDRSKKTALALLDWLMLDYPYGSLFAHGISEDLSPESDKKRKLAALIAMEHALRTWNKLGSTSKQLSTESNSMTDSTSQVFGDPRILSRWISLLAVIVHEDGAVTSDVTISMTRLTVLALDICIALSPILADKALREAEAEEAARKPVIVMQDETEGKDLGHPPSCRRYFESSLSNVSAALRDMKAWNVRGNPLVIAGLEDTLDIITQFHKARSGSTSLPPDSVRKSFCKAWEVISSALCHRGSFASSAAVTEHVQQCLQMQDISPSTKLVTSCLVLGFSNPSGSAEQALQTPALLATPLLDLINTAAVLLHTMTEADFKGIKEQVASILDESSELSTSVVELVSKYTAAFPRAMIPDLIKHLQPTKKSLLALHDLGSVRATRNAVRIVEVLAENDFFVAAQSNEMEDQITDLEEAMVQLLQDKDIMIRMTASQIVAALDPTKIVNKFAPELSSTTSDVRSSAELVLLESMLLQRKDGTLGDGFVAVLSYIRGVFHSNLGPKEPTSKVKSPSQLLSKTQSNTTKTLNPESARLLECLLRVLRKLGESIPSALWPSFVDRLVAKTHGSPRDQVWIMIWNELAPSIVSSGEAILALSTKMLEMMEQQGTLTEEMVKNAVEASDEAFDDLHLARVLPMLILKASCYRRS
ncbi:hypothetical protein BGZ70_010409 [Mortierella alpina]|uniref:Uncharacterized protein n=1 Tax=Mortierella alpina TaxID=64518 RepID=A0A9P6IZC5_MORAP|nr:hypothetical protein BGZ70_010409 [Mortierella alpina]